MKLLIVDDEASAIQAVQNNINWDALDFTEIATAGNKAMAIEQLRAKNIDVLLCDIEMPMGSGIELLEWVNENTQGIQCVFMTCHADFGFAQRALQLGSFDYVLKPLDYAGDPYMMIFWNDTDAVSSWSWDGFEGVQTDVKVYTPDSMAELLPLCGQGMKKVRLLLPPSVME